MPVQGPDVPEPRGLQLWVDLPKQFKMVEPSYQELGPEECVVPLTARRRCSKLMPPFLQDRHRVSGRSGRRGEDQSH